MTQFFIATKFFLSSFLLSSLGILLVVRVVWFAAGASWSYPETAAGVSTLMGFLIAAVFTGFKMENTQGKPPPASLNPEYSQGGAERCH